MKHLKWSSIKAEALTPQITRQYCSAGNVTVARFELKKGGYVARHQHENEQVTCILQGALKFKTDAGEFTVRAGEFLVIPPNAPHDAEAMEDTVVMDVFSPPRADWESGEDGYLRAGKK